MVVYHRFQPGKLRTYCVLSGSDDRDGRDGSGGEAGSSDEDEVRRNGIVWRMVEVCRAELVVVWWTVEVEKTVVV